MWKKERTWQFKCCVHWRALQVGDTRYPGYHNSVRRWYQHMADDHGGDVETWPRYARGAKFVKGCFHRG
eukprot:10234581-Prorocentrum_lima.AAC.1